VLGAKGGGFGEDFPAVIMHQCWIGNELDSGLREKLRVSPTAHKHNQAGLARLFAAGFFEVIQQRVSACKPCTAALNNLISLSDGCTTGFVRRFERERQFLVCNDTGQEYPNTCIWLEQGVDSRAQPIVEGVVVACACACAGQGDDRVAVVIQILRCRVMDWRRSVSDRAVGRLDQQLVGGDDGVLARGVRSLFLSSYWRL
jgi:hypothetical protein